MARARPRWVGARSPAPTPHLVLRSAEGASRRTRESPRDRRRQLEHPSRPRWRGAPQDEGERTTKGRLPWPRRALSAPQSRVGPGAGNSLTAPEWAGAAVACFHGGVHTTYWSAI